MGSSILTDEVLRTLACPCLRGPEGVAASGLRPDGPSDPDLLSELARSHPRNHRLYAHEASVLIAESGVVFRHSYLDENAAAHVALGKAYVEALEGGEGMTPEELDAVGCNRSDVHLDVAFGSAAVEVTATGAAEVAVLRGGLWNEALDT